MNPIDRWINAGHAQAGQAVGGGIPWLEAMRGRALDRFAAEGWPGTRQAGWRHTSLASLEQAVFSPGNASDEAALQSCVQALRAAHAGHWLVFADGKYHEGLSQVGALPAGAHVMALSQALTQQPEAVQALYGDETLGASPAALNLAMGGDGGFVRLAAGVALDEPVHLVFVASAPGTCAFPRNLIAAGKGARLSVVEHYLGTTGDEDAASFSNALTRIEAAPGAQVTHMKLQAESRPSFHVAAIHSHQQEGSRFHSHALSFGARLARTDIETIFDGEHCETLLNGLYHVDGRRHVDHTTLIHHAFPNGSSREFYRGILADQSRGVFGGRILVAPGADGTDAVQRSDSLLLSRLARADARPELEIYADDVKCAHGATVGQLDEDALFYLRTRGFDEALARNLLIHAFAAQVINRIEDEALREHVSALVRTRLPGGQALGVLQ